MSRPIVTQAEYKPWKDDKDFCKIYKQIEKITLLDEPRCYSLWEIIKECNKLEESSFIEVGTYKGGSGIVIAERMRNLEIKRKLYLCDTFTGTIKSGDNDPVYENGVFCQGDIQLVIDNLDKYLVNTSNIYLLEGVFPDDLKEEIKDKFCFCHIDVDIYQSAKDIVKWIWDKMVINGIIVFDDYGFPKAGGVAKFVNELKEQKDCLFFYNINGQGIIIKIGN